MPSFTSEKYLPLSPRGLHRGLTLDPLSLSLSLFFSRVRRAFRHSPAASQRRHSRTGGRGHTAIVPCWPLNPATRKSHSSMKRTHVGHVAVVDGHTVIHHIPASRSAATTSPSISFPAPPEHLYSRDLARLPSQTLTSTRLAEGRNYTCDEWDY